MTWQKPSKEMCPKCGHIMLEKGNKLLCSNEAWRFCKKLIKTLEIDINY